MHNYENLNLKAETSEQLIPLLTYVDDLIETNDYVAFEEFLRDLPIKECSVLVLMSLLRTSYRRSEFIPGWNNYLSSFKEEVLSRGRIPDRIFRGLDKLYSNSFKGMFPFLD